MSLFLKYAPWPLLVAALVGLFWGWYERTEARIAKAEIKLVEYKLEESADEVKQRNAELNTAQEENERLRVMMETIQQANEDYKEAIKRSNNYASAREKRLERYEQENENQRAIIDSCHIDTDSLRPTTEQ